MLMLGYNFGTLACKIDTNENLVGYQWFSNHVQQLGSKKNKIKCVLLLYVTYTIHKGHVTQQITEQKRILVYRKMDTFEHALQPPRTKRTDRIHCLWDFLTVIPIIQLLSVNSSVNGQ